MVNEDGEALQLRNDVIEKVGKIEREFSKGKLDRNLKGRNFRKNSGKIKDILGCKINKTLSKIRYTKNIAKNYHFVDFHNSKLH